jgi:hypothetical protein
MYRLLYIRFSLLFLLMIGVTTESFAGGDRTSARSVGMARTVASTARGLDAVGLNPALLSIPNNATVEFSLAPAGVSFGSNFMNLDLYNAYFSGVDDPLTGERVSKHLTEEDKQDILDAFPGGTGKLNADARILWFGISLRLDMTGGMAFTVSDRLAMNVSVPNDYFKLIFLGMSEYGSRYDFSGTHIHSWWVREYALSYATPRLNIIEPLSWISFGVGIKRVVGYAYFGSESHDGYISNGGFEDGFTISGGMSLNARRSSADFIHDPDLYDFNPIGTPAGTGWGLDLGVATAINRSVVVGLSLTDIGFIEWTENTYGSSGNASFEIDDIFSKEQQDSLINAYTGKDEEIDAFRTGLPAALRAGATWQYMPNLLFAADYTQGFNNLPGNSTVPRFAVGMEWRPVSFLPLRTGLAVGGNDRFTWAFGFGVNVVVFDFEVATENIGLLLYPNKSKQASITFGTKFRF